MTVYNRPFLGYSSSATAPSAPVADEWSYENVIAIRAVETTDFMTADFSRIPHEVLGTISSRIINEVRGINREVYDVSSNPPLRSIAGPGLRACPLVCGLPAVILCGPSSNRACGSTA